MTARDDERNPSIEALSMLTTHEPDPARSARVLARGRARLVARANRRPLAALRAPRGGWGRTLEPLFVAGASAVFLLEVLSRATRLYRF